ncbi:hypothetical protein ATE47_13070 [Chryseobacterium sp. IHB B 17019]|jgi:hypothetical protein|uniref:hypothetical protein n=1 Tax=Chryseobacterium sp. IHB B 17019 TaxID=1721091 RepID=UPI00071FBD0B|nr:hypothetical protein [Chryseobacterium sp. IHB B 17019]ALR31397.1 hypothetical protein ATE47_13070 [Chryseobacterium sp. IHB B 17019]
MNRKSLNMLLISVAFLIIVIYNFILPHSSENSYLEKIKNENIYSIVIRKFIDYNNHGIPYIVYKKDSIIIYREWENQINIGDSIIKPKGSLNITIKNPNKVLNLNYEDMKDLELPNP